MCRPCDGVRHVISQLSARARSLALSFSQSNTVNMAGLKERTAKEKVVDDIYASWGGGKYNDPEVCNAEFAKHFTEDAYFKCSAAQVHPTQHPQAHSPPMNLPRHRHARTPARIFAARVCALPGRSVDARALWRDVIGQGACRQSIF